MIQMRTWLTVADNSGARKLTCIMPVGGDAGLQAGLGDVVTAATTGDEHADVGETTGFLVHSGEGECAA